MSFEQQNQGQRWYDARPQVSRALYVIDVFPDEVKTILAEGIVYLAEAEFHAHEIARTFRSLGPVKIQAYYKSRNKLRRYDKNPPVHKIVTYMTLISEPQQEAISGYISDLTGHAAGYFQLCRQESVVPQRQHVVELKDLYVNYRDIGRMQSYLDSVQTAFRQGLGQSLIPRDLAPQPQQSSDANDAQTLIIRPMTPRREVIQSADGDLKITSE